MSSMKPFIFATLLVGVVTIFTGCFLLHHHQEGMSVSYPPSDAVSPPADIVVSEAPPPPAHEVIVASPGPAYSWVPGYWSWQGRWVWVRGAWVIRPDAHAVYVPGRWVHRGHGYVWNSGHWK